MSDRIGSDRMVTSVRLLIWNLAILSGALVFSDVQNLPLWNHSPLFWTILVAACLVGSLAIISRGRLAR